MQGQNVIDLKSAFETFNEMSAQLTRSYQELEQRVARLTAELAEARTEKLRQLAEKERLADRLATLLEVLPGGVLVLDAQGRVSEANPGARDLLGVEPEGRIWNELAAQVLRDGGEELRLADGRRVSLAARPLADGGQVLLLSDLTEASQLQQMLHRNRRLAAMGEVAARLAHQIRTPLASVLLYLSQLEDPALPPEQRALFVSRSRERLQHLEQMIHNLLSYARGAPAVRERFPVEALLDAFQEVLVPQVESRGGRLIQPDVGDGLCLEGDFQALLGALVNLGVNALQACERAPRLQLEIWREAGRLRLELADNGRGMDSRQLEQAFEPFFTTRSDGTGLGLAVVKSVVESHHGRLHLESRPGQGTRAVLELPLAACGEESV